MTSRTVNLRAAYGKNVLHDVMLKKYQMSIPKAGPSLPRAPPSRDRAPAGGWSPGPVCIIGAGSAGLATAIYIHDACVQAGVTPPTIDIYEATERSGGRVYTYQFTDTANPATHNYYDIGAMRIPDIMTMNSTLKMIDYLKDNKGQDIIRQPYTYSDPEKREPLMYYYRDYQPSDIDKELSQLDGVIQPFIFQLESAASTEAWDQKFQTMCQTYDKYSTRAYLQLGNIYGTTTPIKYGSEISMQSTGLFDQAWMETVCDYADFQAASAGKWYRLEDSQTKNGMQAITNAMENYLKSMNINVKYKSPVTSLVYNQTDIAVSVVGGQAQNYESVINTTTMGCLGRMDIAGLQLDDDVLTGVRALSYDRATKVAIKFNSDWWTPLLNKQASRNPKIPGPDNNPPAVSFLGGVSSTDLPISNVVYPSWQDEGSTILMISYAWAQDATRMTSLIPDYAGQTQINNQDPVAVLCMRYLAQLWQQIPGAPTLDELQNKYYQSHHAWAWANDPNTAGAFALFGPGQFSYLYPLMQQPHCRGDGSNKVGFYFAGEATSAHHAWISGAFDSAYTTVWQWAGIQDPPAPGQMNAVQRAMFELPFGEGPKKHVAEMDESLLNWAIWASEQREKGEKGK
ncbi:uncharacterized protein A1O5_04784 [Cladophialophora psammophila CBS 110553]|uniref:Amine oxidase domain-containing protein n=1 Tax=Cladophialophora psammophila CBS 110553 TaxID=1182543 RepID=W9X4M7_9EURO|nr:uncharacterized protein A1O5_04784 [Cladophialophora psammophila CBS 110553]EXJ72280.1 hypothetical protein A1O5_04784 [Cladophialophora psammophila CBS 110553]